MQEFMVPNNFTGSEFFIKFYYYMYSPKQLRAIIPI